jgi:hypothetical protein
MTMFKLAADYTASAVLTEEQLELISGGIDAMGNIPTCPPLPPVHGGAVSVKPRWPEFPGSPPM